MNQTDYDFLDKDTTHLCQILPVEIWKIVAGKLKNRKKFNNSSPFFRNLLSSERTLSLFAKTILPLTKVFWENGASNVFSIQDILKCRQVCKTWNKGIDKFIHDTCHYSDGPTVLKKFLQTEINYVFVLDDPDLPPDNGHVHNFLEHFKCTHQTDPEMRSPFISSNISVFTPGLPDYNDEIAEDVARYLNGISTMLHLYGTHVTDFTFEIFGGWMSYEYALSLQKWLGFMPNLVHLKINDHSEYSDINDSELETFFRETPFPKLNFLEKITGRHFTAPLFNHLIKQNNHISDLYVKEGKEQYDIFEFKLSNLKALKVKFDNNLDHILKNPKTRRFRWPITSFIVSMENVTDFMECKEFFQLIQTKFGNTLKVMFLKFPRSWKKCGNEVWQNFKDVQLCLPNLRDIHFRTWVPISLDFLLPMRRNLNEINVDALYSLRKSRKRASRREEADKPIVEFCGFEIGRRILKSNIWTKFENLVEIVIRDRSGEERKFENIDWELEQKSE